MLSVLPHNAFQQQAEHLHAERILVSVAFHIGQTGLIKVTPGLKRPNAGVPHVKRVWLRRRDQVAAEVHHGIRIALDAHRLVRVLLRLKQRPCILWLAGWLAGWLNCCISWRTITASSPLIFSFSCGSRSSSGMISGKCRITRRRDTPPLRSVKRIGLLLTARITAGMCVE